MPLAVTCDIKCNIYLALSEVIGKEHILSTQSRGYSDIKFCSFYKNKRTHLKPTFLKRHSCLKTIRHYAYMIGSYILSHGSSVMRFGPGVETQFSHGSGTSTGRVNITKL